MFGGDRNGVRHAASSERLRATGRRASCFEGENSASQVRGGGRRSPDIAERLHGLPAEQNVRLVPETLSQLQSSVQGDGDSHADAENAETLGYPADILRW